MARRRRSELLFAVAGGQRVFYAGPCLSARRFCQTLARGAEHCLRARAAEVRRCLFGGDGSAYADRTARKPLSRSARRDRQGHRTALNPASTVERGEPGGSATTVRRIITCK